MRKGRKKLFLYGLVMLLVLTLTGAAWGEPTETKSSEQKNTESQSASVFKDVEAGDSNLIYINYLAKREIISGFPDGGFHPNEGLTRAQAATLLVKAAGLSSKENKSVFKDVSADHWAAPCIAAAAKAGYLKGYPDGTYHPDEKLSRAQGISLVLRLSKQKDTGVELPNLKDLDSKHWAARSAAIGLAAGMVGLSSDKTQFLPDADFSRGDLSRALAVLLTTDPDLNQTSLDGSLEIKKGEVKVNDQKATGTIIVKAGDLITTSAGAEAQLSYPDGSSLLIKENSKITVKETRGRAYIKTDGSPGTAVDWLLVDVKVGNIFGALATNPNAQEEDSENQTAGLGEKLLAGLSGALQYLAAGDQAPPWYKTAEVKKVKVQVDMPYGVAAIRGSFWNNMVSANGSGSTSLLEGSGEVTSGGHTVPLPPGQSSNLNQSGTPPTPPAPMTPQQVAGWVQQGSWLQAVAQNMQNNQAAPMTGAGISQALPGQPNPQPPVPNMPNITNLLNQALNQAQQNAGFTNIINLNNLPGDLESYIPPGYTPPGGGGTSTTTEDSGPTPSSVLAGLVNTPAYLQVNSITVDGSSLSLSGKTYPGNTVRLTGMLLQNAVTAYPIATADAYGNFSFSNVSINSSAAVQDAFLVLDQLLDNTDTAMVKATLAIPNVLNSPALPALLKINRGLYTDASTPVLITGQVLPAQSQTVDISQIGGTEVPWTGTVADNGTFSIPIDVQSPGTQLGVCIAPATSTTSPVSGGGHTYVYSADTIGVMFTMPSNGMTSVASGLNSVQVFFDRNVEEGSSFDSISITPSGGSVLSTTSSISGNQLSINGSLSAGQTYIVNIPAGAVQDATSSSITLPAFSFSFSTDIASILGIVPFGPAQIYAGDPCILPATVRANMSDGTISELAVTWNPATINTSTPGTYTSTGTVAGYGTPVSFTLIINPLPSASSDTTIFSENFESTLTWTTGGLWNVLDNSSDLQNGAVPKYVTLPYGDVSGGYLPNTPYGSKCLWYGKTASTNPYEVGNFLNQQMAGDSDLSGGYSADAHMDSAITPTITLPSSGTPALSFNSWWEIESIAPAGFDMMTVHILDENGYELSIDPLAVINPESLPSEYVGSAPVAYSSAGKDLPGIWQNYCYDLSAYLGQDIKIKFQFNTNDYKYNGFRGWFIDDVKVLPQAPGTIGIIGVNANPNPAQFSNSVQSVNVDISSSGLANGTVIAVQLFTAGAIPTGIGSAVNTTVANNAATAILSIPASYPEGNYIIRVSGTGFSTYDLPFLISNWMGLVNDGTTTFPGASTCSVTDLAGDSSNGLYAAYTNSSLYPVVKKLSGTSWLDWGPQNATGSGYVDLALTPGGDAYLAYRSLTDQYPTVLNRVYDSSTWTDLVNLPDVAINRFSLTTANDYYPYLSYSPSLSPNTIQTYVYNPGNWNSYSPITASSAVADISLDWDSYYYKPYLVFSTGSEVYGYYYSSTVPVSLGIIDNNAASDSAVSLLVDSTGNPYVAYRDSSDNVMVKMYSGSAWTTVGSTLGTSAANYVSLALSGTTPYVVYSDTSGINAGKATVKYLNGSDWTALGMEGFSLTAVTEPKIRIIGSDVYVIYRDTSNNIKVMKRTLTLP